MAIYEPTAEQQLEDDRKVSSKHEKNVEKMEGKKKWFGGGKGHSGILGLGASDESIASEKKEAKEYSDMANQQYNLRKSRERKEASASDSRHKEYR